MRASKALLFLPSSSVMMACSRTKSDTGTCFVTGERAVSGCLRVLDGAQCWACTSSHMRHFLLHRPALSVERRPIDAYSIIESLPRQGQQALLSTPRPSRYPGKGWTITAPDARNLLLRGPVLSIEAGPVDALIIPGTPPRLH